MPTTLECIALALNSAGPESWCPAMNGKLAAPGHAAKHGHAQARGVEFIGPEPGMLSCGYEGLGRLWEVIKIVVRALQLLGSGA